MGDGRALQRIVHRPHQCRIHPSVASAPVAVAAVRFAVGRHEVLVSPPESLTLVQQAAGQGVARPAVHPEALFGIARSVVVAVEVADVREMSEHGQTHLYGINPGPVGGGVLRNEILHAAHRGQQHVEVEEGRHCAVEAVEIKFEICLTAAVVVGITGLDAVARGVAVGLCPTGDVRAVALLRVNPVQRHQTFKIDAARPQVRWPLFLDKRRSGWVGIFAREVVVAQVHRTQHVGGLRQRPGRGAERASEKNNEKDGFDGVHGVNGIDGKSGELGFSHHSC